MPGREPDSASALPSILNIYTAPPNSILTNSFNFVLKFFLLREAMSPIDFNLILFYLLNITDFKSEV